MVEKTLIEIKMTSISPAIISGWWKLIDHQSNIFYVPDYQFHVIFETRGQYDGVLIEKEYAEWKFKL